MGKKADTKGEKKGPCGGMDMVRTDAPADPRATRTRSRNIPPPARAATAPQGSLMERAQEKAQDTMEDVRDELEDLEKALNTEVKIDQFQKAVSALESQLKSIASSSNPSFSAGLSVSATVMPTTELHDAYKSLSARLEDIVSQLDYKALGEMADDMNALSKTLPGITDKVQSSLGGLMSATIVVDKVRGAMSIRMKKEQAVEAQNSVKQLRTDADFVKTADRLEATMSQVVAIGNKKTTRPNLKRVRALNNFLIDATFMLNKILTGTTLGSYLSVPSECKLTFELIGKVQAVFNPQGLVTGLKVAKNYAGVPLVTIVKPLRVFDQALGSADNAVTKAINMRFGKQK
jgi:hypothetical protein